MDTNGIELSDNERQLFGHLFTCYDHSNSGSVAKPVAIQLLHSSQLDAQVLDQILELCVGGSPSTVSSLSRHQFYSMLKLVGAAQSGLPLNQDTIAANPMTIPLPQLSPISWDLTKHKITVNNRYELLV
ncbi:unnamed protein product, partial [Oppiella nova]